MSAAAERLSPAVDWLAQLAEPMLGDPAGEDPRAGDRFRRVKEEIERLADADFHLAVTLCRQILLEEGRDLRVLGYHALAALYAHGVDGLAEGLRAYIAVVDRYWDEVHPRRPNARAAAVEWLNNPRFAVFFERAADAGELSGLETLQGLIAKLNAVLTRRESGLTVFGELRQAVESRLKRARDSQRPAAVPISSASGAQRGAPTRSGVSSDAELQQATREILGFLRQQSDWVRLVSYARALRWGLTSLPPNDQGRTRIAPLRPAALATVEAAQGQAAWQDMLLAAEAAFLEPGGQFCLRLQKLAAEAAEKLGRRDIAALIGQQTSGLLARLPELRQLSFEDGSPFADADTQRWLDSLAPTANRRAPAASGDKRLEEARARAEALAREAGLGAGLAELDKLPARPGRAQARLQLAKAELCLALGRADLALPVLERLAEPLANGILAEWDPEWALQVWMAQETALKRLKPSARLPEADIGRRLDDLRRQICRLDVTAAADML